MRKKFILSLLLVTTVSVSVKTTIAQNDQFVSFLDNFYVNEYSDNYLAKVYLDSAENMLPSITDPILIGDFYLYKGWYFQDISDFNSSRAMFYKSLTEYEKVNAYQKIANVYGNLGNAYLDVDNLKKSLDFQEKSLLLNQKIALGATDSLAKDAALRGEAYALTNIASIYLKLKDYDRSLEYQLQSLDYEKMRDDSLGMAISYQGIGELYEKLEMDDSAFYYLNFAKNIFEKENYGYGLTRSLQGLAEIETDSLIARNYLLQALDLALENQETYNQLTLLSAILRGGYELPSKTLQNFARDIQNLQQDTILAVSCYAAYRSLADYFFKIGKYSESSIAYQQYIKYHHKDQLITEKDELQSQLVRHELKQKSFTDSLKLQTEFAEKSLADERKISNQKTIITIAVAGGLLMLGMLFFLFKSIKTKSKNNRLLNTKNQRIQDQKELVDEKNKQITDSINYAKRLQSAILPPLEDVQKSFKDLFILFKPKDVVSGDFFWFERKGGLLLIAAADCTGHGVPGAMVSVVCSNALNRSVNEFDLKSPSEILNKTREIVIETFARSGEDVKDGMDISLCVINKESKTIKFSGANNPVWICRNLIDVKDGGELKVVNDFALYEHKGDKQPVGLYSAAKSFTETEIEFYPQDTFYLFTDGYADQFGGEEGKKLKYKTFKEILLNQQQTHLSDQHNYLNNFIDDWMGDLEQVDDICVIGFKP